MQTRFALLRVLNETHIHPMMIVLPSIVDVDYINLLILSLM